MARNTTKGEAVARRLRRLAREVGPGGRLPTFRALMRDLAVSQSTVAAALRQLESEGVTETRPGSGVFVAERANVRPVLLLIDAASVIGPSPFWEILLEALIAPYRAHPERLVVEFTSPIIEPRGSIPVDRNLEPRLWARLKARQVGGVMAVCVDERLTWELERLGIPVVGYGCPSHTMLRMASLEACGQGVAELARLGCKRIALYNALHLGVREVFTAALAAHGASECVVPPTVGLSHALPRMGHRHRLIEHGMREAMRTFGPEGTVKGRPDGVLSVDDMFTQGYIMGLERVGVAPGRDVEIASHMNKGSPTLAAWHPSIVGLEFDVRAIAAAMHAGIAQLMAGETPNQGGWEHSILMHEKEGPLRTLMVRPAVRRKGDATVPG